MFPQLPFAKLGAGAVRIERVSLIERVPRIKLPTVNLRLPKARENVLAMGPEGPEWLAYQSALDEVIMPFYDTMPFGSVIGSAVCCAGSGIRCSSGNVSYSVPRTVGARAWPAAVNKSEAGTVSRQGTITGPGRMNGPFGWSADRDLMAGCLASYVHNWVGKLIGYFSRPPLPLTEAWSLPNLTLAETRAPDQFHPAASFTFNHPPSPFALYTTRISSETPAKIGLDWWDPGKADLARVDEVQIDAGVTDLVSYITLPLGIFSGFFTVNVLDAPKGITVESVDTVPPCL